MSPDQDALFDLRRPPGRRSAGARTPLQNRVSPTGEIVADPARGMLMGNRGCLHNADGQLIMRWRSPAWISCVLDFRGIQRDPMPAGRWTALFFLDEATALAAGHRPCWLCRRTAFYAYVEAWRAGQGAMDRPLAIEVDGQLHKERIHRQRQVTRKVYAGGLPDGAMVRRRDVVGLVLGGRLLPWSFAGYGPAVPLSPRSLVELLTPPSSVAALTAGYRPVLHPSAITQVPG